MISYYIVELSFINKMLDLKMQKILFYVHI